MECFPVCRNCTGLCKQAPPERAVSKRKPRKKPVTVSKLPGYIILLCGHYTTAEEQRVWFTSAGRRFPSSFTRRTKFFCERDGRWVKPFTATDRKPEIQLPPLPGF